MLFHLHHQGAALAFATLAATISPAAQAQDQYVAEVRLFAFDFCPKYWAPATGALLSINQNSPLFSLLGTDYGGNGTSIFNLPDLRGRVPVGTGQGAGTSSTPRAQQGGAETTTLTNSQMPAHTHNQMASAEAATHGTPANNSLLAQAQNGGMYADIGSGSAVPMNSATAGADTPAPVNVRNPYLGMTWCIATQGYFPPRP